MIYTSKTKLAMKIAYEAHQGQYDKNGIPYIYHPIHLAEQCDDEITTVIALLHDVVEDNKNYTFEKLEQFEFGEIVISTLKLLTHIKGVPYMEYIKNIKENKYATKVKLLDLEHNLDENRFDEEERVIMLEKMSKKREYYKKAKAYLME